MKRYRKVDKIYYDMFIKDKVFKTPYFIANNFLNYDNKFYVFKNINSTRLCFNDLQSALNYINKVDTNPIIIILPILRHKKSD